MIGTGAGGGDVIGTGAGGGGVIGPQESGGGVIGAGGASTGGGTSVMGGTLAGPLPPEKCEPIAQLPAGVMPVCTYAGGRPGRVEGCSQFPVHVFMDSGSYYLVSNDAPAIVQCPRGKDESALLLSTGTFLESAACNGNGTTDLGEDQKAPTRAMASAAPRDRLRIRQAAAAQPQAPAKL